MSAEQLANRITEQTGLHLIKLGEENTKEDFASLQKVGKDIRKWALHR